MGQVKAFDKKGPHTGMFSVKYKDDPNYYTHSLLREDYGKDKNWVLLGLQKKVSCFSQSRRCSCKALLVSLSNVNVLFLTGC